MYNEIKGLNNKTMALLGEQFFTIYNMDKDFAFNLANILKESTEKSLNELKLAINELEIDKAKRVLHTIKGSSANFGAEELMNKSHEIESAIYLLNENNKLEYLALFDDLNLIYENTMQELETHR